MKIKTTTAFLLFICISINISLAQKKLSKFNFMIGKWKRENKEQYEVWEAGDNSEIKGYGYKMIDNKQKITETLVIKKVNDQIILEPTVPDQNEGKAVQFTLNTDVKTVFSFENPDHDFPKRIQYQKINKNAIRVIVAGAPGQGFSYVQYKVKE